MSEPTALPDIAHVNGEHAMLTEFLDYFRTVFLRKVEDLDRRAVTAAAARRATSTCSA